MKTLESAPETIIESCVSEYAHKGVFRGLEIKRSEGELTCSFHWLSKLRPMKLVFEAGGRTISLEDFFPTFPIEVEVDVARLLDRLVDEATPVHRRVDPEQAELAVAIDADGPASLVMTVKNDDYEYALKRLVNVASEFFHSLQVSNAEYSYLSFGGHEE